MTDATSSLEDARNRTSHAVAELLAGSGLQAREDMISGQRIVDALDPRRA